MKTCSVEGCKREVSQQGFCVKHFAKYRKYGDPSYGKEIERHYLCNSIEYRSWRSMKSRCYDPNNNRYYRYGGRGITVCDRWNHSFTDFLIDMGPKPFLKAQIDRINNDKNYEPNNCRWVASADNNRNRCNNKMTISKVQKMRDLYKTGIFKKRDLGKIYKISESLVGNIISNKSWKIIGENK